MQPDSQAATVRGSSMEPFLFAGDLVELAPVAPGEVLPGGVYAFPLGAPAQLVAHRCRSKEPSGFVFQGDHQPRCERTGLEGPFFRVERVLERRVAPPAPEVVLGVLKHLDAIESFAFPRHTLTAWPWDEIFAFATRHRVLSGFAYALQRSALWDEIPAPARELYRLDLFQQMARHEKLQLVVSDLASTLPEGRLLKGADVSRTIYPEPFIRIMFDVDVLVDEKAYDESIERLLENGFSISEAHRRFARRFHEARLVHDATGVTTELHRALFQKHRYRFDSREFLARADDIDELLYLCAHALTHYGRHINLYWDIYRFIATRKPDLARTAERARQRGAALAYAFALRALKSWWNFEADPAAETLLSARQRLSLAAADLLYLDAFDVPMMSFRKRALQCLVADSLWSLAGMICDPTRIYMTHFARE